MSTKTTTHRDGDDKYRVTETTRNDGSVKITESRIIENPLPPNYSEIVSETKIDPKGNSTTKYKIAVQGIPAKVVGIPSSLSRKQLIPPARLDTMKQMPEYSYTLNIDSAEESGYNGSVPALPRCFSYGHTCSKAVEMAKEANRNPYRGAPEERRERPS